MDMFLLHVVLWAFLLTIHWALGGVVAYIPVVGPFIGIILPYTALTLISADYFNLLPVRMIAAQYAQIWRHIRAVKYRLGQASFPFASLLFNIRENDETEKEINKSNNSKPKAYHSVLKTTTEYTCRVWPGDLDMFYHMNNAQYLQKLEWARFHFDTETGIWSRPLMLKEFRNEDGTGGGKNGGPGVGLATMTVRYRRELAPFQKYYVVTRVAGWNKSVLFLEHRIETDFKKAASGRFVNAHGFSVFKLTKKALEKYPKGWVQLLIDYGEEGLDESQDEERLDDGLRALIAFEGWSSRELMKLSNGGASAAAAASGSESEKDAKKPKVA